MADIIAIGGGFGSANSYGGYAWGEATRQALQNYILAAYDTSHAHTVDGVVLVQQHTLVVQDASHGHTVDNIVLTQHTLVVNDTTHSLTSDNLALTGNHIILIDDTRHRFTDSTPNIINWSDLALYFGGYIPTIGGNGNLTQADKQYGGLIFDELNHGTFRSDRTNVLSFEDFFAWLSEDGLYHIIEEDGNTDKISRVSEYGILKKGMIEYGKL